MTITYKYELLSDEHIYEVAKIHFHSLNMGILSNFGEKFLFKMYQRHISDKNNFGYVAKENDSVVGFVTGLTNDFSLIDCLDINSLKIFTQKCITNPILLLSLIKAYATLRIRSNITNSVELSHFAVKESFRGQSIGINLISHLQMKSYEHGYTKIWTTTHNPRLVKFYIETLKATVIKTNKINKINYTILEWGINFTNRK